LRNNPRGPGILERYKLLLDYMMIRKSSLLSTLIILLIFMSIGTVYGEDEKTRIKQERDDSSVPEKDY
jgi:hypothetical protein